MTFFSSELSKTDPTIFSSIQKELDRQKYQIELIASENIVSRAVLEAQGSVFTNKYAEGYPAKRYYGGCEFSDEIEQTAIDRLCQLFGAKFANVQPHSGASANLSVYLALLQPGDTILGMSLAAGGHLTHGAQRTISGMWFKSVQYGIRADDGLIDYEQAENLAREHKPKLIVAGISSYPRIVDWTRFKKIADEIGALLMVDMAHIAGLIVAGVLKNPFDFGFNIITTTTHKTLRGPRGGMILSMGKVSNPLKAVEKTVENLPTLIDRSVFPGFQGGPHMNNTAAKAVAFGEAMKPSFKVYARQIVKNAKAMADELMKQGCKLITNGTDNHLMVMDCIKSFGIDGKEVEQILDKIGITTSKSTVPDDPLPPFAPSGLRLGTPAMTTRGMKEKHMRQIAKWVVDAAHERKNSKVLKKLKKEVVEMSLQFPVPGIK